MKILVLGKGISSDGVKMVLDQFYADYDYLEKNEVKSAYDYIIKSPGIPLTDPVFKITKGKIISDIELVSLLVRKYYIGITGTNGKTTITMLLNEILQKYRQSIACGNIGYAVGKAAIGIEDYLVCELSSFQLESVETFKPKIAILSNIEPHHLDHHGSFSAYLKAKAKLCQRQSEEDVLIYNYDSTYCREIAKKSKAKKLSFSTESMLADCFLFNETLYFKKIKVMTLNKEEQKRMHDIANYMAVLCALSFLNIPLKKTVRLFRNFKRAPYRVEEIYPNIYNDAKSTNPYSTVVSLKTFERVALLCGGYDRKEPLDCLNPVLSSIEKVYAYGESRFIIQRYCQEYVLAYELFSTLKEATLAALKEKKENTVILYSPMYASYDQYKSYLERGKEFTTLVLAYYHNNHYSYQNNHS